MKKSWLIISVFLVVALIFIIIIAPKLLNFVFEKTTRVLEQNFIRETTQEYHPRINRDFAFFITAYKKNKIKKGDLDKLSKLIKKAYKDKKLVLEEIEEILLLIENITPKLE